MILLLAGAFSTHVSGQRAEKVINKEYTISQGFTLGIDNKYGEIRIGNWDKDELSVVVTVTAESRSNDRAEELLDKVDIDISESKSEVDFETHIANNGMSGKNRINVVYEVRTPAWINVNLAQSYGDVFIQEITGVADLEVRYGSLTANSLALEDEEAWNALSLAYGEASIEYVSALGLEVKYSEVNISESMVLDVESAYSKMYFGNLNDLMAESKYDKIAAAYLSGALELESAYTQVSVDQVSRDFTGINIGMKYGNFKAGLQEGTSFEIDAEVSYGSLNIPDGQFTMDRSNTGQYVEGTVGSSPKAVVIATMKYGNLVLD